jgi:hypothetical protein
MKSWPSRIENVTVRVSYSSTDFYKLRSWKIGIALKTGKLPREVSKCFPKIDVDFSVKRDVEGRVTVSRPGKEHVAEASLLPRPWPFLIPTEKPRRIPTTPTAILRITVRLTSACAKILVYAAALVHNTASETTDGSAAKTRLARYH